MLHNALKEKATGNSVVVQWVGLRAFTDMA